MMMKTNITPLLNYLDELFPSARCELFYSKDYELVIAVMLSAQTTDKSVNAVTKVLFNKYQSLDELNAAPIEDIEEIIKQIGLYKNKAKNLKGIVKDLIIKFQVIKIYFKPYQVLEIKPLVSFARRSSTFLIYQWIPIS